MKGCTGGFEKPSKGKEDIEHYSSLTLYNHAVDTRITCGMGGEQQKAGKQLAETEPKLQEKVLAPVQSLLAPNMPIPCSCPSWIQGEGQHVTRQPHTADHLAGCLPSLCKYEFTD